MEKALKRDIILRNGRRKYVDKLLAELYEKLAGAHEVPNIKDRVTEIKYSIWEEFEPISKLDAQILDSIIEIQTETEAESEIETANIFRTRIHMAISKMDEELLKMKTESTVTSQNTQQNKATVRAKLPKRTINKFDGPKKVA